MAIFYSKKLTVCFHLGETESDLKDGLYFLSSGEVKEAFRSLGFHILCGSVGATDRVSFS